MVTKIYGIYGIDEANLTINFGKVSVKCEFKNGIIDPRNPKKYPAKLMTSNFVAQTAIEHSPMFNNKIFLLETLADKNSKGKTTASPGKKTAPAVQTAGQFAAPEAQGVKKEYPEVTTVGDAINVLKSLNVKASELKRREDIFAKARELGISFPELPE